MMIPPNIPINAEGYIQATGCFRSRLCDNDAWLWADVSIHSWKIDHLIYYDAIAAVFVNPDGSILAHNLSRKELVRFLAWRLTTRGG